MARITGIGGVFFKSTGDHKKLSEWYASNLGLQLENWGGAILKWPETNLCSDGTSEGGHPRGWGSFTRVLGYYVREQKLLTLEEAIKKLTSLAANHVGIEGRGSILPGYYADLVLFDPLTVKDRASFTSPHLSSTGIEMVWVNGKLVWNGKETGERPGVAIKAE